MQLRLVKSIQMILRILNNREINYYLINSIKLIRYQYRKITFLISRNVLIPDESKLNISLKTREREKSLFLAMEMR